MADDIAALKEFRDKVLLKNSLGRSFVKFYYKVSQPLADYLGGHETLRTATRLLLMPVVYGVKCPTTSVLMFLLAVVAITLTLKKYGRRSQVQSSPFRVTLCFVGSTLCKGHSGLRGKTVLHTEENPTNSQIPRMSGSEFR